MMDQTNPVDTVPLLERSLERLRTKMGPHSGPVDCCSHIDWPGMSVAQRMRFGCSIDHPGWFVEPLCKVQSCGKLRTPTSLIDCSPASPASLESIAGCRVLCSTVLLVMFEEACVAAAKAPGSAGECEQILYRSRRSSIPEVLRQVLQQCLSILPANADSYHDLLPLRNGLLLLQRFCHR